MAGRDMIPNKNIHNALLFEHVFMVGLSGVPLGESIQLAVSIQGVWAEEPDKSE